MSSNIVYFPLFASATACDKEAATDVLRTPVNERNSFFVRNWFRRWRARRVLRKDLWCQPDSVLEDAGYTRSTLQAELAKSFWTE